ADGAYVSGWGIAAGGTFEPASIEAVKAGRTQMRRDGGSYPKTVNEDNWPRLFKRLCAENSFTSDDVDQMLFTQISKPSIGIAAERCGVPAEKCHTIMEKYGYAGSACIRPSCRGRPTVPARSAAACALPVQACPCAGRRLWQLAA